MDQEHYPCRRLFCSRVNPRYLSFNTRKRAYCLEHVPWHIHLAMRVRGIY